jgi:AcrR family transcriptional regulator
MNLLSATDVSVSQESTSAPARSRAATRERLLRSATELFASRGIERVTSHDVAREAGVAAGTFYLHFKDKRELFREIVFAAVERLRDRLDAAGAGAPVANGALEVRLRTAELIAFAEDHRDLIRILFGGQHGAADLGSDVLDHLAERNEAVLRGRPGAQANPLHSGVTAQAVVGMLARVVAWWAEDPARAPREQVIETLIRIQLSGTHPESSAPSGADPESPGPRPRGAD